MFVLGGPWSLFFSFFPSFLCSFSLATPLLPSFSFSRCCCWCCCCVFRARKPPFFFLFSRLFLSFLPRPPVWSTREGEGDKEGHCYTIIRDCSLLLFYLLPFWYQRTVDWWYPSPFHLYSLVCMVFHMRNTNTNPWGCMRPDSLFFLFVSFLWGGGFTFGRIEMAECVSVNWKCLLLLVGWDVLFVQAMRCYAMQSKVGEK